VYCVMHMIRIGVGSSNMENLYMPVLKSSRSPPFPKTGYDPSSRRRASSSEAEEQKLLRKIPPHPTSSGGSGRRREAGHTKQRAVRPWWKIDPSGQVSSIKFGAKLIEFEKGKAGIVVQSRTSCWVIDALISAGPAGDGRAVQPGSKRKKG